MVCRRKRRWTGKLNIFIFLLLIFFFFSIRLNVFYQLLMKLKDINFLMFYQKKLIKVFLMVIYGFQSFLIHQPINLLVFNDVLVVLSYYSVQCYSILCIMIYLLMQQRHPTAHHRLTVYPLVHFI
jgi:hypothetical protein